MGILRKVKAKINKYDDVLRDNQSVILFSISKFVGVLSIIISLFLLITDTTDFKFYATAITIFAMVCIVKLNKYYLRENKPDTPINRIMDAPNAALISILVAITSLSFIGSI